MADKEGAKDKKKALTAVETEGSEVDDNSVKQLSFDFQCGQRILSQVHILCQVNVRAEQRSLSCEIDLLLHIDFSFSTARVSETKHEKQWTA